MAWNPNIETISGGRHRDFLRLAYQAAWYHSDDPVTKVGAVVVTPDLSEVLGVGVNSLPKGIKPTNKELQSGEWRYNNLVHAEEDAIVNALDTYVEKRKIREKNRIYANIFLKIDGATMYMPWAPCYECAERMVEVGITEWVGHKEFIMKTPENWQESLDEAIELLGKSGVETFMYEGRIHGVRAVHRSIEWQP